MTKPGLFFSDYYSCKIKLLNFQLTLDVSLLASLYHSRSWDNVFPSPVPLPLYLSRWALLWKFFNILVSILSLLHCWPSSSFQYSPKHENKQHKWTKTIIRSILLKYKQHLKTFRGVSWSRKLWPDTFKRCEETEWVSIG